MDTDNSANRWRGPVGPANLGARKEAPLEVTKPTGPSRGPFDPRLLRYVRATRTYLVLSVGVGGATAVLVIAQAWLIATG
jgi:hypothetical protein